MGQEDIVVVVTVAAVVVSPLWSIVILWRLLASIVVDVVSVGNFSRLCMHSISVACHLRFGWLATKMAMMESPAKRLLF